MRATISSPINNQGEEMMESYIYKLGDGPINYNWNKRYITLNYLTKELSYFMYEEDAKPRGSINVASALISNIELIKDRPHSFMITPNPPHGKNYYISCDTLEECTEWRNAILKTAIQENPNQLSPQHKSLKLHPTKADENREILVLSGQEEIKGGEEVGDDIIFSDGGVGRGGLRTGRSSIGPYSPVGGGRRVEGGQKLRRVESYGENAMVYYIYIYIYIGREELYE